VTLEDLSDTGLLGAGQHDEAIVVEQDHVGQSPSQYTGRSRVPEPHDSGTLSRASGPRYLSRTCEWGPRRGFRNSSRSPILYEQGRDTPANPASLDTACGRWLKS
jgi:hypothetical protein